MPTLPSPSREPRLSIVVDVGAHEVAAHHAIACALAQTGLAPGDVEVIAVADGTRPGMAEALITDDRIRVVTARDSGQAAACNAGFAASRGRLVLFLDAEDTLYPEAASEVLAAWEPGISKVQFLLDLVDAGGRMLGRQVPRELHDVEAPALLRLGGAYGSPPGSGNAYDRDFLARVMPLDEGLWRTGADSVPILLAPLHGRVMSLPLALGAYRLHRHGGDDPALVVDSRGGTLYTEARRIRQGREAVAAELARLGAGEAGPAGLAPWDARTLVLCARFGNDATRAELRPSPTAVMAQALRSVWQWPLITTRRRLLLSLWMLSVWLLPGPLAHRAAQWHRRSAGAVDPHLSARTAAARLGSLAVRP